MSTDRAVRPRTTPAITSYRVYGVAAMMLAAMIGGLFSSPPVSAASAPSDSAVTMSGHGDFADLTVTVSQTRDLINQTVTVS